MFDYKEIIGKIKLSGYPYYRLKGRTDSYSNNIINIGDNLSEEEPTVDSLLYKLDEDVKSCVKGSPKFIFELELFKTKTSNQSGKLGVFEFMVQEVVPEVKTEKTLPNQNFGGFGNVQEQMSAYKKMQDDLQQPRVDLERDKTFLEFDKRELAREKKEFDRYVIEKEAEIKEAEIVFNKKSEIAKNGAEKAIWNILEKITGEDSKGLGGTAEIEGEVEATSEEKMIESIALNILGESEAGNIDIEDIKIIGIVVQKKINEIKE